MTNGVCQNAIPTTPGNAGCAAYCEIRIAKIYGQEVPYPNSNCNNDLGAKGNISCTISNGISISKTYTTTIDGSVSLKKRDEASESPAELEAAFSVGASYSWSTSIVYTTTSGQTAKISPGVCLYWTFIPWLMEYEIDSSFQSLG
jgi:hypothetical protein